MVILGIGELDAQKRAPGVGVWQGRRPARFCDRHEGRAEIGNEPERNRLRDVSNLHLEEPRQIAAIHRLFGGFVEHSHHIPLLHRNTHALGPSNVNNGPL